MKHFIVVLAFLALPALAEPVPSFPSGTLAGIKIMTIKPIPGRTTEQFLDYYTRVTVPQFEKAFEGLRIQLLKSARGPNKGQYATLWIFNSEAARDRYFTGEEGLSERGKKAWDSLEPARAAMAREVGTWTGNELDDWIVQ
jgi:hypothetical protein